MFLANFYYSLRIEFHYSCVTVLVALRSFRFNKSYVTLCTSTDYRLDGD